MQIKHVKKPQPAALRNPEAPVSQQQLNKHTAQTVSQWLREHKGPLTQIEARAAFRALFTEPGGKR